jgi:hypothetical protein
MCIILFSLSKEIGETYAAHPATERTVCGQAAMSRRNEVDRIKQPSNGLEKGIVRDFAKPMFPEPPGGIKLGRVRRQCHELDPVGVRGKLRKNGFGKMDPIGIDHHVGLTPGNTVGWLKHLREY